MLERACGRFPKSGSGMNTTSNYCLGMEFTRCQPVCTPALGTPESCNNLGLLFHAGCGLGVGLMSDNAQWWKKKKMLIMQSTDSHLNDFVQLEQWRWGVSWCCWGGCGVVVRIGLGMCFCRVTMGTSGISLQLCKFANPVVHILQA